MLSEWGARGKRTFDESLVLWARPSSVAGGNDLSCIVSIRALQVGHSCIISIDFTSRGDLNILLHALGYNMYDYQSPRSITQ